MPIANAQNPAKFNRLYLPLIAVGFPLLLFLVIEIFCRALRVEAWINGSQALQLEMPTWMALDDNTEVRGTRLTRETKELDWLPIFEPGDGFRVRLKPNLDRVITNTFSRIPNDPDLQYLVKSNSGGFRSAELTPVKSDDTFRVLVFGDSSSFGWGVNQGDSYAEVLKESLGQLMPGRKIEVGNFSMPGDSSEYGALIYREIIPQYSFDAIILGFGANDAKLVPSPHRPQVERFAERAQWQRVRFLARKSALYRVLEALAQKFVRNDPQRPSKNRQPAVGTKRYGLNLRAMGSDALSRGGSAVIVLNLCTPKDYARRAEKIATESGFQYLNGQLRLLELIPDLESNLIYPELVKTMRESYPNYLAKDKRSYVTSDGCHPNKVGHRIIAEELARILAINSRGNIVSAKNSHTPLKSN